MPTTDTPPNPQIQPPPSVMDNALPARWQTRQFGLAALLITAAFALPLLQLFRLSLRSELHSYIILIPVISIYLVWMARRPGPAVAGQRSLFPAVFAGLGGLASLGIHWSLPRPGSLPPTQSLWLLVLAWLLFVLAAALFTLGWSRLKPHAFALGFLVFMLPLPPAATDWMSMALQHASAEASDVCLRLTGLPVLRTGMIFQMPGLTIQVAEECSGLRSTLILFITSLLAGKLFLRAGWKRAVLALATIPLGILRNAFRITTLSWLTVNVDAGIIHGPLHHQGGPFFFALSLVPLFLLLWTFRKSESAQKP